VKKAEEKSMKVTKMGGPRWGLHQDGWPKTGTSPRWVAQDGDYLNLINN